MATSILHRSLNNIFSSSRLQRILPQPFICTMSKNIDAADVYRHTQHMKLWWDTEGPMKPLHSMNHLRTPFIKDGLVNLSHNISTSLKGIKILDVGCGGGILSESLAKLGAEVTGIDASKELIECAQNHSFHNKDLEMNRPTYYYSTVEEHAENNIDKYDAVVASEIIEHVYEKDLFVQSCIRATKTNGKLFFTTPSKTRIAQLIIIHLYESLNIIPRGTHQYEKLMTPNELKHLLEIYGCSVEMSRGFYYNPLKNDYHWATTKLFMFAIQATKLRQNFRI